MSVPFIFLGICLSGVIDVNLSIDITSFSENYLSISSNSFEILINDIVIVGTIISLMLIAFSKEKMEDEYVSTLRLESLQWAIYCNFALLIIFTVLINGIDFFTISIYNMFTPLFFFILRFNYLLHFKSYESELKKGGLHD